MVATAMNRRAWTPGRKPASRSLCALVAMIVVTACQSGGSQTLDVKRTENFSSVAALRAASDLVVVGRATSERSVDVIEGASFTVTKVDVERVIQGDSSAASVKVRQTGTEGAVVEDDPLLGAGDVRLLFLKRFRDGAGNLTEQYRLTGLSQGQYKRTKSGDFEAVHPEGTTLPNIIERHSAALLS